MPKANLCPYCDEPLFNLGDETKSMVNGVQTRIKCVEITDEHVLFEVLEGSLAGCKLRMFPTIPDTMRYVN